MNPAIVGMVDELDISGLVYRPINTSGFAAEPAVYFIKHEDDLLYIGNTKDCAKRMRQHVNGGRFPSQAVVAQFNTTDYSAYQRRVTEALLIFKHHPLLNKTFNSSKQDYSKHWPIGCECTECAPVGEEASSVSEVLDALL